MGAGSLWSHTNNSEEGSERQPCGSQRIGKVLLQFPEKQVRLGEAFWKASQARNNARPAPAAVLDATYLDLQHIARFSIPDEDGTGDGVDLVAVHGNEVGHGGGGRQLGTAGIQAVEDHGVTRVHLSDRRQAGIPAIVGLGIRDAVQTHGVGNGPDNPVVRR